MAAARTTPESRKATKKRCDRRRYAELLGQGLCRLCRGDVKAVIGKTVCAPCLVAGRAKYRGNQNCKDCRRDLGGSKNVRCDECLGKKRDLYRVRAEQELCVICGDPAEAGAFCRTHWLKQIGAVYGLNAKNGGLRMLAEIWDAQQGRCAVTGETLRAGVNASLDHLVPVSRGGISERANIRWVTKQVNFLKWDQTNAEFLAFCEKVVAHADHPVARHRILGSN